QEIAEKLVADLQIAINENNKFISITKIFNENSISTEQSKEIICKLQKFFPGIILQPAEEAVVSQDSFTPVTELNPEIERIIAEYHIGGVILSRPNFKSKEQAKKLVDDFKKAATRLGNSPILVCVDQEGGKVERFNFSGRILKDNLEIKTSEEAFQKGQIIGKELREIGIICDFAPVVDINSNPKNPIINTRSFGDDPNFVAKLGVSFVKGLHSEGIMATAKHFPGHGDTNEDSHLELPVINKNYEELSACEFIPFQVMSDNSVDMIMTAHIAVPKVDGRIFISKKNSKEFYLPATLSSVFIIDLLRNKIGFKGVIIADGINMGAITENIGKYKAIKMAIEAGNDIILIPIRLRSKSGISRLDKIFSMLKSAVSNGEISEARLNESVERILKLKDKYCKNPEQEIETSK
ncbi:MAG: glycoside hydrolase family 3 protein, partial [Oscillospiraceae bacterium]|nr:glycoside hydrolase family 3 protein [Oscillospiraceae bacterium]